MPGDRAWFSANGRRNFPFATGPTAADGETEFAIVDVPSLVSLIFNGETEQLVATFNAPLAVVSPTDDALFTLRLKRFDPDTFPVPTDPNDPDAWFVVEQWTVVPGDGETAGSAWTGQMAIGAPEVGAEDVGSYSPPPYQLTSALSGTQIAAFTDRALDRFPFGPAPVAATFNTSTLELTITFDQPISISLPAPIDAFYMGRPTKQYKTTVGGSLSVDGKTLTFTCYQSGSAIGQPQNINQTGVVTYTGLVNGLAGFEFEGYPPVIS